MGTYETFANELEALRAGRVRIEELWNRYHAQPETQAHDFETILAFVEHYVADCDIRLIFDTTNPYPLALSCLKVLIIARGTMSSL